jgi:hypothetical protein
MLRFFVLLLVLANGAYFAWAKGHLAVLGLAPTAQQEPQRLRAQIKPEAVRLLNASDVRREQAQEQLQAAQQAADKATVCLESGWLSDSQANTVRAAAASLPENTWRMDSSVQAARWIIYMGKYANAEALNIKKSELRQLGVSFESLRTASLEPGVALGVFDNQKEANTELAKLTQRGVRTAKVLQETPQRSGQQLKLPAVDEALKNQLDGIRSALGSVPLVSCKS